MINWTSPGNILQFVTIDQYMVLLNSQTNKTFSIYIKYFKLANLNFVIFYYRM